LIFSFLYHFDTGDNLVLDNSLTPVLEKSVTTQQTSQHASPVKSLARPRLIESQNFDELSLRLDESTQTMWCYLNPKGPPSFTPPLLRELNQAHRLIHQMYQDAGADNPLPVKFYVTVSELNGIFNLGGDLNLFLTCIKNRDHIALRNYAYACVEAVYNSAFGFTVPVVTVCVLEGDALGGGFEAAMSCNVLIAERGVKMGLPEVLFNSFPGMGAYSFLARKLGPVEAEKIILSGTLYTAEDFHAMGIVDVLVNRGEGREAAHHYVKDNLKRHSLLYAINRVKRRVDAMTLAELRDVTDIWVDTAMALNPSELRKMDMLLHAQMRRLQRGAHADLI
jgi:DSF synthase